MPVMGREIRVPTTWRLITAQLLDLDLAAYLPYGVRRVPWFGREPRHDDQELRPDRPQMRRDTVSRDVPPKLAIRESEQENPGEPAGQVHLDPHNLPEWLVDDHRRPPFL